MLSGTAACFAALAVPLGANAQSATLNYYTPPKMLKQGSSQTPIAGPGAVVVQVLVHPDGTFKVQQIIRSSNHGDDAAALEIAKTSTYTPATRGTKKILAFYDYTVRFTSGGAQSSAAAGGLGEYDRELRAGNYKGAQAGLQSYVASHPNDSAAEAELGVADTYLNDSQGATAAFDAAGTIPDNYKAVAARAYVDRAVSLINAKDYPGALAAAKRGVAVGPGFASYDTRGVAELESGDAASALADIAKAHDIAKTETAIPAASRANNAVHLMQAYLANDNIEGAKSAQAEALQIDPSTKGVSESVFANYYTTKASAAQTAGKYVDAAGLYEQSAAVAPSSAALLYASAALEYLKVTPDPDNDKAGAAADKALAADANNPEANYAKGVALANQGKKSDALTFLNKADSLAKAGGKPELATSAETAIKQLNGGK